MFKKTIWAIGAAMLVAPAMAAEWGADMEQAKEQAAKEGKAILINFTGSDWCSHCRRMKYAVLDTPEFANYVADKYVLLEVDLPRRTQPDAEVLEKRKDLCRKYNVSGFPTFVMINASGEVLDGFTGGNADFEYMRLYLDSALKRSQQLQAAREQKGEARAKALAAIYNEFPKRFENAAAALRREIAAHDPHDITGLQKQATADTQMNELSAELAHYGRHDYQGKAAVYDAFLAKAQPDNIERIMERKRADVIFPCLNIMLLNAKNVEDIHTARDYVLKEAETCYPDAIRAEMIQALKKQFESPEKMLEDIKRRRR
ncbi:MAG: thioredoxin family protein [Akkermansia sp.]|nr:thioredoxin family protein [Akkermansia sp.]